MAINLHKSWDITSKVLLKFTLKRNFEGRWTVYKKLIALKIIQSSLTIYCLTLQWWKYNENLQGDKIGIQKRPTLAIDFIQLFDITLYKIWRFFNSGNFIAIVKNVKVKNILNPK
jgi:hypothetical protein